MLKTHFILHYDYLHSNPNQCGVNVIHETTKNKSSAYQLSIRTSFDD